MENLINKIVDKKEIRGISKELIFTILEEYKKSNINSFNSLKEKNFNPKCKEFIELKKYVRKRLRELHGVFQKNKLSEKKQISYVDVGDFDFFNVSTQKFLKSHVSTNERLSYYESLYGFIEGEIGSIKSLVDLGCGLNPLSYSLLKNLKNAFCVDINNEEISFLQNVFLNNKSFIGEAVVLDLSNEDNFYLLKEKSSNSDCCFLFKLLDSLESIKRGSSRKLLNSINSKFLVVSFSNKTISGKNNIVSERKWFQNILKDFELKGSVIKMFSFGFEDYFLISNNS